MAHHSHAQPPRDLETRWTVGPGLMRMLLLVAAGGIVAAVAHALLADDGYRRFMLAYLVAFAFVLSLSLGALFFVLMQHLTRAGWSVLVRRIPEALAANLPVVIVLFIPIALSVVFGHGEIYPWAHAAPAGEAHDAAHASLTGSKATWLSAPMFLLRWGVILAIWTSMGLYFWRKSLRQDHTADHTLSIQMEKAAGPATVLLGVTLTLGAFDLLMSLDPHWYSTIFGIYYFSGSVVGALSAITLLIILLQRRGVMTRAIGEAHYLDLGRLLFAFLFFWAYIAFSQYMLLWYANIPETTGWLRARGLSTVAGGANAWSTVAIVLLFGHFFIAFAGLMSRHVKARPILLAGWAAWMLVMHYLDLLWIVMPQLGEQLSLGLIEIGLLIAVTSLWCLGVLWRLNGQSLVPLGDPRLSESTIHETVY